MAAVSSAQIGTAQLTRSPACCSLNIDQPITASVQLKKCKGWPGQSLKQHNFSLAFRNHARRQYGSLARASLETVAPATGKVTEVGKDSFWPAVNAAGDQIVVLDMYTQW